MAGPALRIPVQELRPGVVAGNERKHQSDCGAPDISVTDGTYGDGQVTFGVYDHGPGHTTTVRGNAFGRWE